MTTKDDISVFSGEKEMTFNCKVCRMQFASMPMSEVIRRKIDHSLDSEVTRIVDQHLTECKGQLTDT